MPWWGVLLIVVGSLLCAYVLFGFILTWIFLRGKMRTEEESRRREMESNIPEEIFSYPHEEKYLTNKRGLRMFARIYYAKEPTDKWVLLLHGFSSNGIAIMKYGKMFNEMGYNAISPDFCHCGRSEGKYVSFGWHETSDAMEWLDYIKKEYEPARIGVFGVSMGAATAVHLTARRRDVDFLISYCSYASYKRIVVSKGKDMTHFPFFGIFWPVISATTYLIAGGAKAKTLDVSGDLNKVSCPTLLLHSKKDDFTDFHNTVDMYEANKENGNLRLHLFEEGVHARAYATNPAEYTRVVKEFIDDVEKKFADESIA